MRNPAVKQRRGGSFPSVVPCTPAMRLAPRLVLAFGFVATLSVAGLGYAMREDRRESETKRFEEEVRSACDRVVAELGRQGESDRKLVAGACQSGNEPYGPGQAINPPATGIGTTVDQTAPPASATAHAQQAGLLTPIPGARLP